MEYNLKDWTLRTKTYNNLVEYCVVGTVFGSRIFLDGTQITTSPIVKIKGNRVKTRSGSTYVLVGQPHADFFDFLLQNQTTVVENSQKLYNADSPLHFLKI